MFSGKSEELIRRLRRAQIARQPLQVFKPVIDTRYAEQQIMSHSQTAFEATPVATSQEIERLVRDTTRVVGVDEAQFFDRGIVEVAQGLANRGARVVLAGLDQDFTGKPFEPMPELLAIAEYVTKTLAICIRCGAPAGRTQRLVASDERVLVGEREAYEARCRSCHHARPEPQPASLFPRKSD